MAVVAGLILAMATATSHRVAGQSAALTLEAVVARAAEREAETIQSLKVYRPMLEVYLQRAKPNADGDLAAQQDAYLLGRFNWFRGPRLQDPDGRWEAPEMSLAGVAGERLGFRAHGFAATLTPDWQGLEPSRYTFTLVRRESLGEARCIVIDVAPKKRDEGFAGRIWVEDRTFQIVRFNGINRDAERDHFDRAVRFNVDGWRANVLPGLWLPSYLYIEEAVAEGVKTPEAGGLRSQIRLWGYDPRAPRPDPGATRGSAPNAPPEDETLDQLTRAKLLAAPGPVEDVLETVVRNLMVTNDIPLDPPVRVRVLLTAPLESFTLGRTLILSRGLVDVLPDEATLAFMLARELAHVLPGEKASDEPRGSTTAAPLATDALLTRLRAKRTTGADATAREKAVVLLRNSPYKDGLANAAAFLRTVTGQARAMSNFIPAGSSGSVAGAELLGTVPNQGAASGGGASAMTPAALPPGARLGLDPWSSRLSLIPNAAQAAGRGLAPMVIAPLRPHVTYAAPPGLDYRP